MDTAITSPPEAHELDELQDRAPTAQVPLPPPANQQQTTAMLICQLDEDWRRIEEGAVSAECIFTFLCLVAQIVLLSTYGQELCGTLWGGLCGSAFTSCFIHLHSMLIESQLQLLLVAPGLQGRQKTRKALQVIRKCQGWVFGVLGGWTIITTQYWMCKGR